MVTRSYQCDFVCNFGFNRDNGSILLRGGDDGWDANQHYRRCRYMANGCRWPSSLPSSTADSADDAHSSPHPHIYVRYWLGRARRLRTNANDRTLPAFKAHIKSLQLSRSQLLFGVAQINDDACRVLVSFFLPCVNFREELMNESTRDQNDLKFFTTASHVPKIHFWTTGLFHCDARGLRHTSPTTTKGRLDGRF